MAAAIWSECHIALEIYWHAAMKALDSWLTLNKLIYMEQGIQIFPWQRSLSMSQQIGGAGCMEYSSQSG